MVVMIVSFCWLTVRVIEPVAAWRQRMKWRHQHGGESQLPGFHSFKGEQLVRNILETPSGSLHQQNLNPMIVLQLNMKRADNLIEEPSFKLGQPLQ